VNEPQPPVGAVDPVCGMSVEPVVARARNLVVRYADVDYFFCGRGCKLDFEEDPARYLAPDYTPSM
jgi:YHS domain-containing protein